LQQCAHIEAIFVTRNRQIICSSQRQFSFELLDNELLSVTVISADSIDGDIYTTLLYGMGIEKGLAYLQQCAHIEAIFVTRNRQIICSSQRQFSFELLDDAYHQVN